MHVLGTNRYKVLREKYWNLISKIKYVSEYEPDQVMIGQDRETGTYRHQFNFQRALLTRNFFGELFNANKEVFYINPNTEDGKDVINAVKMGLASAFILYDNYALVIQQFYNVDKFRLLLNYDNEQNQRYLDEVTKSFSSVQNYKSMVRGYNIYNKILLYENTHPATRNDLTNYLDKNIQSSYIYSLRNEIGMHSLYRLRWNILLKKIQDKLAISSKNSMNSVSKFFGNGIGLVATRKGKLVSMSKDKFELLVSELKNILQPMDVLLEKTPFRLTDHFIPGYWGHVAVWLGTEDQLRDAGLWDDLSEKLKTQVRNGHYVLEALREGVVANTLEKFLNVDSLAILKGNFFEDDLDYYLERSSLQLGKAYDFNFDVESDRTIVCSELPYTIFNKEKFTWPTKKTLGRYTISPDNVAAKATALTNRSTKYSFKPAVLYHLGKNLSNQAIQYNFDSLLKANFDGLVR